MSPSIPRPALGAGLLILAWIFFTVEFTAARVLSADLSVAQIALARLGTQLVILLPWILAAPARVLGTGRLPLHVFRSTCSASAMPLYYLAFAGLPFALATTLTFTQALFLVVLAALAGMERVSAGRWIATAAGFVGVLIVMRPGFSAFHPAMLAALGGALAGGTLMLITRAMANTESRLTIMSYVGILGTLWVSLPAFLLWQPVRVEHVPLLLVVGILGTIGQFLMVRAFQLAEASQLAPIDYVRLIFAVAAGYLVFAEFPDFWTFAGAAVIIASALTITRLEQARVRAAIARPGE